MNREIEKNSGKETMTSSDAFAKMIHSQNHDVAIKELSLNLMNISIKP